MLTVVGVALMLANATNDLPVCVSANEKMTRYACTHARRAGWRTPTIVCIRVLLCVCILPFICDKILRECPSKP